MHDAQVGVVPDEQGGTLVAELLPIESVPPTFWYPSSFIRVVELGLLDLEPWQVLVGPQLLERRRGLTQRFPKRDLVPFARRLDNDDVACWEPSVSAEGVVVVHDYASPGWEDRAGYRDFHAWLRQAVEDLIDFE
jgi:hypothetical protein